MQFAVTRALVGQYVLHDGEAAPDPDATSPWYWLDHHFEIEPGEARLPKPPITGGITTGERPTCQALRVIASEIPASHWAVADRTRDEIDAEKQRAAAARRSVQRGRLL